MSRTSIEWCCRPGTLPEVWNLVTGCNKVDRGCKHCYAEIMHRRLMLMHPAKYDRPFLEGAVMHPDLLDLPLSWKKPRTVFVNSMSDLFHEKIPFRFIRKALEVMYKCKGLHTFIILTKRVDRVLEFVEWMRHNINLFWMGFDENVWIVASINDQPAADNRVSKLLKVPAVVRGLSCEPLTGPVNISHQLMYGEWNLNESTTKTQKIHWVVAGGESGHKADPMHPDWARSLRDQSYAAGVPFFFKQFGEWSPGAWSPGSYSAMKAPHKYHDFGDGTIMKKIGKKESGRLLDGREHNEFPIPQPLFTNELVT